MQKIILSQGDNNTHSQKIATGTILNKDKS